MSKVFRVLRFFSVIIFLGVLMFVYAYLPKDVVLSFIDNTINKETFFYIVLGLFVLVNLLFTVVVILNKNLSIGGTSVKKQNLINWVTSLPVMVNLYLTFMIGSIGIINNANNFQGSYYSYLNYLGPILLFSWILALIFILTKKDQIASESTN